MRYIVKKTLEKIVEWFNHFLVKVKNNQRRLLAALEDTILSSEPVGYYREESYRRGRLEIREIYLYKRQDNLAEGWESIHLIAYVVRHFLSKNGEHKTESIYVSDLETIDAKYIAEIIRSHWYIENKLHYVKDVIMAEDRASTRNKVGAANLALFRDIAFNILKTENKSIKQAIELFATYSITQLLRILLRI